MENTKDALSALLLFSLRKIAAPQYLFVPLFKLNRGHALNLIKLPRSRSIVATF